MPNIIQRMIYNLSIASPLFIVFSVVLYIQKKTMTIPIVFGVVAIILVLCLLWSFSYGQKKLAPMTIRIKDITPNDGWIIVYIIAYILPLASLKIQEYNIFIVGLVCLCIILVVAHVNNSIPNPILFFLKYHFYSISTENGVSEYILISKRKLRNSQNVKAVKRLFEYLLLDTEN